MIKPNRLKRGDVVATVSLSKGMCGAPRLKHKYELGKKRLEEEFGLIVKPMEHSLESGEFTYLHPELRAQDLMNAFRDPEIKAIICNVGGDDTIRLLPYIDLEVIKNNPKIFMGYSDTTINHFMMYQAGLVSFYGPCVLMEFAENVQMFDYTKTAIEKTLFHPFDRLEIPSSTHWTSEYLEWGEEKNDEIARTLNEEQHYYEVLQGTGFVRGKLLGGCIDVFQMFIGSSIWPSLEEWQDKILFIETSEDHPAPFELLYIFRNPLFNEALKVIKGVIIGKPKDEKYYEEYKTMYLDFFQKELKRPDLPILYNMNFGHTSPITILPIGCEIELDLDHKTVTLVECPTIE